MGYSSRFSVRRKVRAEGLGFRVPCAMERVAFWEPGMRYRVSSATIWGHGSGCMYRTVSTLSEVVAREGLEGAGGAVEHRNVTISQYKLQKGKQFRSKSVLCSLVLEASFWGLMVQGECTGQSVH
jgi:hypothetical protein